MLKVYVPQGVLRGNYLWVGAGVSLDSIFRWHGLFVVSVLKQYGNRENDNLDLLTLVGGSRGQRGSFTQTHLSIIPLGVLDESRLKSFSAYLSRV